jgi:hypothetical protein
MDHEAGFQRELKFLVPGVAPAPKKDKVLDSRAINITWFKPGPGPVASTSRFIDPLRPPDLDYAVN